MSFIENGANFLNKFFTRINRGYSTTPEIQAEIGKTAFLLQILSMGETNQSINQPNIPSSELPSDHAQDKAPHYRNFGDTAL